MTINSPLSVMKHTDDQTVDYWEWSLLSPAEKEYFTANHDYIGSRPSIVCLRSWKDLPIPSVQKSDLSPQRNALFDWTGVSHLGRSTTVVLTKWLALFLKEELISPKRAYFLRTENIGNYFSGESDVPRTYISFFRWRNIIFMLGNILNAATISDADLRQAYAWIAEQAPPTSIDHLIVKIDTSRKNAHRKWMSGFFNMLEMPKLMSDEAAAHIRLPTKIKEFAYIHRGFAQLYAVTNEVTAYIHPDSQDDDHVYSDYEWHNQYCIVVNIADLENEKAIDAIRIAGRDFHTDVKAPHPHIHADGNCCWGGFKDALTALVGSRDVIGIFHTVQNFCQIIDPESLLENFPVKEPTAQCSICDAELDEDDEYTCDGQTCATRTVCPSCSTYYECCSRRLCTNCVDNDDIGSYTCEQCSGTVCTDHEWDCDICGDPFCKECLSGCDSCSEDSCRKCTITCIRCKETVCVHEHCSHELVRATKKWKHQPRSNSYRRHTVGICTDCWNEVDKEVKFCAHCHRPVLGDEPLLQCDLCERIICKKCVNGNHLNDQFFLIQNEEEGDLMGANSICEICSMAFLAYAMNHPDKDPFLRSVPVSGYEAYKEEKLREESEKFRCEVCKTLSSESDSYWCDHCDHRVCDVCDCHCRNCEDNICTQCRVTCESCDLSFCNDSNCIMYDGDWLCHPCRERLEEDISE